MVSGPRLGRHWNKSIETQLENGRCTTIFAISFAYMIRSKTSIPLADSTRFELRFPGWSYILLLALIYVRPPMFNICSKPPHTEQFFFSFFHFIIGAFSFRCTLLFYFSVWFPNGHREFCFKKPNQIGRGLECLFFLLFGAPSFLLSFTSRGFHYVYLGRLPWI